MKYDYTAIEKKWQKIWDDEKAFAASDDYSKPKYYALVEFPYPSKVTLSCALTLPEGYEVEEIPHTQVIKTEDGKLQCKYAIQRNRNNVIVNYTFILSSSVVPSEYYGQLQQIWNKAVEMNQALIVLKKELPKD